MTETARCATLVLPAKGAFEKSGTTLNLAGDLLPVEASLEAPDGVLADLDMLDRDWPSVSTSRCPGGRYSTPRSSPTPRASPMRSRSATSGSRAAIRPPRTRPRPSFSPVAAPGATIRRWPRCATVRLHRKPWEHRRDRGVRCGSSCWSSRRCCLLVVVTTFAYAMLAERKVLGWMQLRPGPNRVGPWGLMQPAADAAKLMLKEDLTPKTADPLIYRLAPFISLLTAFSVYAIIPFGSSASGTWAIGNVNAGILLHPGDHVDRRLRHLAGRLGVGLEVSAARQRALDRADDQLRTRDVAFVHRRADSGRHDLARRHRERAIAMVVLRSADRRVRDLHHHRGGRDESHAVRFGRGGDRTGRRLPHRVLGAALRAVLHRRVREHVDGLVHRDAAVLRRMERAVRADGGAGQSCGSSSKSLASCFSTSGCARRFRACDTTA